MTEQTGARALKSGLRPWMVIPALGAAAVLAVFMLGLQRDDIQRLPSTFIDRPVPEFTLAPLDPEKQGVSTATMNEPGIKLLNIWASWCGPCRLEHPYLMDLAADGVTIHGFNYKDAPENARAFLSELGDPYELIGTDPNGRNGIEFGVYGVPETFVINGDGVIIYKHVGPIVGDDVEKKILPAIEAARAGG